MARRKRWAAPRSVYLYRTPGGWRHSVHLLDGSMVCGGLGRASVSVADEVAQAELQRTIELLLDVEGSARLRWRPSPIADGWTADIEIQPASPPG